MSAFAHVASQEVALTGSNYTTVVIVAIIALAALGVAAVLVRQVLAADEGTDSMKKIALAIQEGASAYLNRQFRTLAVFGVLVFFLLFLLPAETQNERIGRSLFFLVGAVFSGITGYMGMWLAVRGNVRVANAANTSGEQEAMKIAFRTGGVAGMFTVGLGLFGAALVVLVYKGEAPKVLEGFGFGAALLAMFMRVGGGIFTKAADVGADLVGKVEQGIPEDDPRNAATIADNVGDNVGDCAGMAADLFESYAVTLVAALILGKAAFGEIGLVFPLVVPAIGVVTAVVGIFAVTPRAGDRSGMSAINRGFFLSAAISAVLVALAAYQFLPATLGELQAVSDPTFGLAEGVVVNPRHMAIGAVLIGIVLAAAIQQLTGYFTETNRKPVDDVSKSSLTGPATVILAGISLGLESAVYSALLIGAALYGAYLLGGVSGDVHGEGAQVLTNLDAVGNTTKAITKGIAIATAVFAATALFGAFRDTVTNAAKSFTTSDLQYTGTLDISNPANLFGLLIGSAVVFMFSGLAINAVSRAAGSVIFEVRRQFREKPGIMAGTELPDYSRVVDIVTKDSLRELTTPGLLAILTPIAVGFGLGIGALGSFLAGTIATGTLMAVFLSNSGGAWDNAKKFVEDGHFGGKGSEAHSATVIGDTVGDPFKDTAGPAINPLLKVMNLVALLIAPAVVAMTLEDKDAMRIGLAFVATAVIVVSVIISKRRPIAVGEEAMAS